MLESAADHAARLVWLMERRPRVAFGWSVTVNTSSNSQSRFGRIWFAFLKLRRGPVCRCQIWSLIDPASSLLKYTLCQGVARWTRPSQPNVGNGPDGKFQLSVKRIPGSRMAGLTVPTPGVALG